MTKIPDIDIDFADRKSALVCIEARQAMISKNDKRTPHPSGVYLQNVPIDPITGLCAYDYKTAEEKGFIKIDLLNQSIYNSISDEEHLIKLMNTEPLWDMLSEKIIVENLTHIGKHYDLVQRISPKSIQELAIVLALIRPAKRYLLDKDMNEILDKVWKPEEDGYLFKKAHAISYAMLIVVQMNLMCEEI